MEEGNIVITPFKRENLGTNSYDITLNPNMLVYRNPLTSLDTKKPNETRKLVIPEDGLELKPGKIYIASSNEYTETHAAVPKIEGKSSLGRLGLFIHVTAGYGDVGFKGQWTLELVCVQPIRIYRDMKIAQISYHSISEMPLVAYHEKEGAKYSNQMGATASLNHLNHVKEQ